jgi:GNAT superfamily N-acetyltransferase
MEFRQATQTDLPQIMKMITAAKAWFLGMKIDQWQNGNPNESSILADITGGNGFVITDAETVIAYGALIFGAEPAYQEIFDGRWRGGQEYATIHRVVTDQAAKRTGAASLLFRNFEKLALARRVNWLRVDTHEDNLPMKSLIVKNNFTYSGVIFYNPKTKRIAFEKDLRRQN